jgi:hypothetical protein
MNRSVHALRAATERARVARQQIQQDIGNLKSRLQPARLKADVQAKITRSIQGARDDAVEQVRSRPFLSAAAVGAVVGWVFRKPLAALSQQLFVKGRNAWNARREAEEEDV